MVKETLTDEFSDMMRSARNGGQPWFVIGGIMRDELRRALDEATAADVRSKAAEASGLSSQILRRYASLLDRIEAIARVETLDPSDLTARVFNAAEVAVRIYDRNPRQGLEALLALKAGRMTLMEVRESLATVPVFIPGTDEETAAGRRRRVERLRSSAAFERLSVRTAFLSQAVERSLLMPPGTRLIKRRPASIFAAREGSFEIVGGSIRRAEMTVQAGLEILGYEGANDEVRAFERIFPTLALLASFYPRFHLVFSSLTPDGFVDAARRLIGLFGTGSIGVARVSAEGDVEIAREADSAPQPDRTGSYHVIYPLPVPMRPPSQVTPDAG